MKKLKGLWFIGIGLLMFVAWVFFLSFVTYEIVYYGPKLSFFSKLANSAWLAITHITYPSPLNLWPITGLALIVIGLFRLVRSLLRSRSRQENGL
jgi:hypothetical protein